MDWMLVIIIMLALGQLCSVGGWWIAQYFLWRNEWVYQVRENMRKNDAENYARLPSYEYMMYRRFWVWNTDRFLPKQN